MQLLELLYTRLQLLFIAVGHNRLGDEFLTIGNYPLHKCLHQAGGFCLWSRKLEVGAAGGEGVFPIGNHPPCPRLGLKDFIRVRLTIIIVVDGKDSRPNNRFTTVPAS